MFEYGNVCDAFSSWNETWDVLKELLRFYSSIRFAKEKKSHTLQEFCTHFPPLELNRKYSVARFAQQATERIRTRHLRRLVGESVTIFDRLLLTAANPFQERAMIVAFFNYSPTICFVCGFFITHWPWSCRNTW